MTTQLSVSPDQLISELDLARFFNEQTLEYDFVEGTVVNSSKTRMIYLSSDIILGIYKALKEETGPAWTIILKNCGRLWGRKVSGHLTRDMQARWQRRPADLTASQYIQMLEAYFPAHGWGRLRVHLDDATSRGVVRFTMQHSLFARVLEEESIPVDSMVSGILQGFFQELTGQSLDCEEIGCIRQGHAECTFVLTHEERLDKIRPSLEEGNGNPAELLNQILA